MKDNLFKSLNRVTVLISFFFMVVLKWFKKKIQVFKVGLQNMTDWKKICGIFKKSGNSWDTKSTRGEFNQIQTRTPRLPTPAPWCPGWTCTPGHIPCRSHTWSTASNWKYNTICKNNICRYFSNKFRWYPTKCQSSLWIENWIDPMHNPCRTTQHQIQPYLTN